MQITVICYVLMQHFLHFYPLKQNFPNLAAMCNNVHRSRTKHGDLIQIVRQSAKKPSPEEEGYVLLDIVASYSGGGTPPLRFVP